jgi:serine/threonine protein kinase
MKTTSGRVNKRRATPNAGRESMRRCPQCSQTYGNTDVFCSQDGTLLLPVEALVGTVLDGKYRIDALKGIGGMGEVYRATQLNLERTVAVKLMRGDFSTDALMGERFKREALAVGRLNHQNITTVFDFGIEETLGAYLVMEFLVGRTLSEELKATGRMEPDDAVQMIRQACSAVNAAHVEGVIHRDLKPDNVFLVTTQSDGLLVKILDFGIAKFYGDAEVEGMTLTEMGTVIGTPIYMSPEQCKGEELDPRSDIYSLGCVLFEMLTGRPPFTGPNISALIVQHATEAPPAPSSLYPALPRALEDVLIKALAKERAERFQTAAEFGEAVVTAWESSENEYVRLPTLDFPAGMVAQVISDAVDTTPRPRQTPSSVPVVGPLERPIGVPPADGRWRIASLPFNNLARDPAIEFLGLTIADGITTELSGIEKLVVRPSAAIAQFQEASSDPREAGSALAVDLLVCGSFLRDGEAFQATAQLVDVALNEVIWQQRISTSYTDAISLQVEIGRQVLAGVSERLELDGES